MILVAANYPDNGFVSDVVIALMGLGLVPLIGGLLALVNSVRMGWVLHRHPWVSAPVQYSEVRIFGTPNGTPTLFFADTNVLTLMAFKWRWRRFQDLSEVWLAGSPERGGVVSVPGGGYLVWAHRPRTPGFKRQLLKSRPKVSPSNATQPDRSWFEPSSPPEELDAFPPLEQKDSFSDLASRLHTAVESPDRDGT